MDYPYTRGVLLSWKSRTNYCNAVLRHRERINLDGLASGEEVDDRARVDAQQQLAQIARRAAERAAAEQVARTTAEAETAAAEVTPVPAPAPPPEPPAETPIEPPAVMVIETPEQLRSHLRAALLRRRA
jgi:sRNA-binding protein